MPPHIRAGLDAAVARCDGASLEVVAPGHNLGVAASWNLGLAQADDWTIISNDDVTFYRDTIKQLVDAAEAQPDELFLFPGTGGYKNAWSLFLQRAKMQATVGCYDEWISPGYGFYEDNDMAYRLKLAGYRHIPVPHCGYAHVDSATVKSMARHEQADHWDRFAVAKQRYIAKWGGEPGRERYTIAFNGTPPAGYRLSAFD
jgi:GT2 family glycosyltransferase